MDQNQQYFNEYSQSEPKPQPDKGEAMATASMVLGIMGMVGLFMITPALIFGGTAITIALLSKSRYQPMSFRAKVGLTTGMLALILAILAIIMAVAYFILHPQEFQRIWAEVMNMLDQYTDTYKNMGDFI